MIKNKVWKRHCKDNVPSNRRLIGHKWVFKVKGNGVFRARFCAIGYSQVARVDFTNNFASVINDVTFRVLKVLMLINNWVSDMIDVEPAFLNGNLEEEILCLYQKDWFLWTVLRILMRMKTVSY